MHPQSKEQLNALKAIAKALKISVETSSYNPDFVAINSPDRTGDKPMLNI